MAAGGRPGEHDAGPGPAHRRRARVRTGAVAVLRRGDRRGVRGDPRAHDADTAATVAAPAGARPARAVPGAAPLPAAAGAHPAVELATGLAHDRDVVRGAVRSDGRHQRAGTTAVRTA